MKNKINEIREKLHKEMQSREVGYEEIVRTSEELDQLILQYYLKDESKLEE